MVRLGKLTDYGLVLMTCIARTQGIPLRTARDLARESKLPISTVSKLLKELLQSGLLISHRGTKGGYVLARRRRMNLDPADLPVGGAPGGVRVTGPLEVRFARHLV